ncbi:MAG: hypothetical protein QXE29_04675 [Candidatus Hadarchaeales archaeon]
MAATGSSERPVPAVWSPAGAGWTFWASLAGRSARMTSRPRIGSRAASNVAGSKVRRTNRRGLMASSFAGWTVVQMLQD